MQKSWGTMHNKPPQEDIFSSWELPEWVPFNYLLSFDFFFFLCTYSGVFNKNPIFGYVNSSAI